LNEEGKEKKMAYKDFGGRVTLKEILDFCKENNISIDDSVEIKAELDKGFYGLNEHPTLNLVWMKEKT
jgi:hypothetical protein